MVEFACNNLNISINYINHLGIRATPANNDQKIGLFMQREEENGIYWLLQVLILIESRKLRLEQQRQIKA
jgi:hypothetical protein